MEPSALDPWNPDRYLRFGTERAEPFSDLLALLGQVPRGGRVVDLGCGSGALTALAHRQLGAAETLGVDNSPAMLERAGAERAPGLSFRQGDLGAPDLGTGGGPFDVVLSNAALHWVEHHDQLLPRLVALLAPGGVLAVQVPANETHASQRAVLRAAAREPFRSALQGWVRKSPVLEPEQYVLALHGLGLEAPTARVQVYLHLLANRQALVDWMQGTTLTAYARRLDAGLQDRFVEAFARELAAAIPDAQPLPFSFRRVLFAARRPVG